MKTPLPSADPDHVAFVRNLLRRGWSNGVIREALQAKSSIAPGKPVEAVMLHAWKEVVAVDGNDAKLLSAELERYRRWHALMAIVYGQMRATERFFQSAGLAGPAETAGLKKDPATSPPEAGQAVKELEQVLAELKLLLRPPLMPLPPDA